MVRVLRHFCIVAFLHCAFASPALAQPTFSADIAPFLSKYCVTCHTTNGDAPFALLDYASVRQHGTQIVAALTNGYMPPWQADSASGPFLDQPRPTTTEIDLVRRWWANGAREGAAGAHITAPTNSAGWRLGTPDLIVRPDRAYGLAANGGDVFRVFVVPLGGDRLRYVRGLEFRPGNRVVHHANLRIDSTRESRERDASDPEPGYDGLLTRSARFPDGHFLGWTPGQVAPMLPSGLAWRLDPDSDLVVQMHMRPSGKAESVWPEIGLYFTDEAPRLHPVMLRLSRQDIDIPSNAAAYTIADSYTLPVAVDLLALQPHAHYRATHVRARAVLPNGSPRPLITIDRWDFRWQHVYRYASPLHLPSGTRLEMEYVYDNSAANPRNPVQPPEEVLWGQRTTEEMGDLWLQVLAANDADRQRLNESFRPKAARDDLTGYQNLLRRLPDDAGMHDDAAVLSLELGQFADAAAHFRRTAQLRPQSASARFNLGMALALANSFREARTAYEATLAIDPGHVRARQQLTRLLVQMGDGKAAEQHARLRLQTAPDDGDMYHQLGLALRLQGRAYEAVVTLREGVKRSPDAAAMLLDLSWMLATDRATKDKSEAVAFAERAVALTPGRDAVAFDTLAVAYAAAGRFDRAIVAAETALAIDPSAKTADDVRARIALYRAGRPYTR